MDYYKTTVQPSYYVSYRLFDKSERIIHEYNRETCFSAITYYTIPKGTTIISIYHEKSLIPYNVSEIRRWIADINEMGFPCSFIEEVGPSQTEKRKQHIRTTVCADMNEFAQELLYHDQEEPVQKEGEKYTFEIKIRDFEYKSHLVSTLMLIRCLTEHGICRIPETYFQMMDENPNADKLSVMQTAHKENKLLGNINHMITYDGNGNNVTKDQLWARYKECAFKVTDGNGGYRNLGQSSKWKG